MTENRKTKPNTITLYTDQYDALDKLWKLKLFKSRNDLLRHIVDEVLEDNKDLLKDK